MNICVTGASRGLGRALCCKLTENGHKVWGIARSDEELRATQQACVTGGCRMSQVDLTDMSAIRQWQAAMKEADFLPDIFILNASVQLEDMQDGYDHQRGMTVLRTNLEGSLACVEAFLPTFLAKKRGSFVAIASTAVLRPSVRSASYSASKAGIAMAFRSLRLRYQSAGIRFATVILGPIRTDMWEGRKSVLVPSTDRAADAIAAFVTSNSALLYYPRISTWLLRLSLRLPDRVFARLSTAFLK